MKILLTTDGESTQVYKDKAKALAASQEAQSDDGADSAKGTGSSSSSSAPPRKRAQPVADTATTTPALTARVALPHHSLYANAHTTDKNTPTDKKSQAAAMPPSARIEMRAGG